MHPSIAGWPLGFILCHGLMLNFPKLAAIICSLPEAQKLKTLLIPGREHLGHSMIRTMAPWCKSSFPSST